MYSYNFEAGKTCIIVKNECQNITVNHIILVS